MVDSALQGRILSLEAKQRRKAGLALLSSFGTGLRSKLRNICRISEKPRGNSLSGTEKSMVLYRYPALSFLGWSLSSRFLSQIEYNNVMNSEIKRQLTISNISRY